jgi:hypothetical protein
MKVLQSLRSDQQPTVPGKDLARYHPWLYRISPGCHRDLVRDIHGNVLSPNKIESQIVEW